MTFNIMFSGKRNFPSVFISSSAMNWRILHISILFKKFYIPLDFAFKIIISFLTRVGNFFPKLSNLKVFELITSYRVYKSSVCISLVFYNK